MILAIIIFCLAFGWLLKETGLLRIRLPYGKPSIKEVVPEVVPEDKPASPALSSRYIPKDETPYMPSVFVQSDIPTLDGELNISCKIEE